MDSMTACWVSLSQRGRSMYESKPGKGNMQVMLVLLLALVDLIDLVRSAHRM